MRRFQARHGISADGRPGALTMKALNIPADQRLNQLKINLARLRAFDTKAAPRFVVCNIPAAQLEAVENGVVASRHIAVAGKPDRPSPELNSKIVEINFNPYWTVPVSIVRKDLIPKMQAEPDYLSRYHIRILDQKNNELTPAQVNWFSEEAVNYRFKQDPGDFNSLGAIRISFPNAHEVYMHDTPFKNLFGEDFRFHSSGCVRIQNVRELVYWLLNETPGWPRVEVDRVIRQAERKDVKLSRPVPLNWIYVTGYTQDLILNKTSNRITISLGVNWVKKGTWASDEAMQTFIRKVKSAAYSYLDNKFKVVCTPKAEGAGTSPIELPIDFIIYDYESGYTIEAIGGTPGGDSAMTQAGGKIFEIQSDGTAEEAITYAHEFGHAILCVSDEYANPAVPGRVLTNDHSIMANYYAQGKSQAEFKARHFQHIATEVAKAFAGYTCGIRQM